MNLRLAGVFLLLGAPASWFAVFKIAQGTTAARQCEVTGNGTLDSCFEEDGQKWALRKYTIVCMDCNPSVNASTNKLLAIPFNYSAAVCDYYDVTYDTDVLGDNVRTDVVGKNGRYENYASKSFTCFETLPGLNGVAPTAPLALWDADRDWVMMGLVALWALGLTMHIPCFLFLAVNRVCHGETNEACEGQADGANVVSTDVREYRPLGDA